MTQRPVSQQSSDLRAQLLAAASVLDTWAKAVERDRREPDKLLCHVAAMRSEAVHLRLDADDLTREDKR